jgi:hypothetical protein
MTPSREAAAASLFLSGRQEKGETQRHEDHKALRILGFLALFK